MLKSMLTVHHKQNVTRATVQLYLKTTNIVNMSVWYRTNIVRIPVLRRNEGPEVDGTFPLSNQTREPVPVRLLSAVPLPVRRFHLVPLLIKPQRSKNQNLKVYNI